MRGTLRATLLMLAAATFTGAQAITFSNFTINGSAAGAGTVSLLGATGITFSIPSHFLVGSGSKSLNVGYRVAATPGQVLTGYTVSPVGTTRNGSVVILNDHATGSGSEVALYSRMGGSALMSLTSEAFPLSGNESVYDVTATITLTGTESNSVNKVSVYNAIYTEAVPEPATLAALGFGLAALLRRKRGTN